MPSWLDGRWSKENDDEKLGRKFSCFHGRPVFGDIDIETDWISAMTQSAVPATLPPPKQAPADRMKRLEERYLFPTIFGSATKQLAGNQIPDNNCSCALAGK